MPADHHPVTSMRRGRQAARLRRRTYEVLEPGPGGSLLSRVVERGIIALIVVNLLTVILESVPSLERAYGRLFFAIEGLSLVVFTVEYLLRLWVAPEHERHQHLSDHWARV